MKRLLVTGASGFLGRTICSAASPSWEVMGVAFSQFAEIPGVRVVQADLTDPRATQQLFDDVQPEAVLHAAAAAKPNYCQLHREESFRINVEASVQIAELCAEGHIPLLFTSTDMVFDGLRPPYKEEDPICPINAYGEQKALAEEEMARRYPEMTICRLPLMFGFAASGEKTFFQQMVEAMKANQELKLFDDERRSCLSADTAAAGLLFFLGRASGVFHLGGREGISRYHFGQLIARVFQLGDAKITPCSSGDVPMPAPRPPDLSLDISKAAALGFHPPSLEEDLRDLADIV